MNKYDIIGIVGEGAYGIVYKAKCKETGEFGKSTTKGCSDHDSNRWVSCGASEMILVLTLHSVHVSRYKEVQRVGR